MNEPARSSVYSLLGPRDHKENSDGTGLCHTVRSRRPLLRTFARAQEDEDQWRALWAAMNKPLMHWRRPRGRPNVNIVGGEPQRAKFRHACSKEVGRGQKKRSVTL